MLSHRITATVPLNSFMLIIQNLPKLCSVVAQCVSAFSVDFWLQTNLFQSGVLWHLLLYLFNYDYTLEEGGVEKSGESNQQVSKLTPRSVNSPPGKFVSKVFWNIVLIRKKSVEKVLFKIQYIWRHFWTVWNTLIKLMFTTNWLSASLFDNRRSPIIWLAWVWRRVPDSGVISRRAQSCPPQKMSLWRSHSLHFWLHSLPRNCPMKTQKRWVPFTQT